MGEIFKGQSSLKITMKTYLDLSGAEECLVKFKKPDGTEGSFTGVMQNELDGIFSYEVKPGDMDKSGWWCFWAFITFIDGRTAAGRSRRKFIREEGT